MTCYLVTVFGKTERALNLGLWRDDTEMKTIVAIALSQLRLWIPGWEWTVLDGLIHGEKKGGNEAATAYLSKVAMIR